MNAPRTPDADRNSQTRRAVLAGGALGAGALGAGLLAPAAAEAQLGPPDDRYVWRERVPVNVKDSGAVGNGTTDDTTAIQSAINTVATAGGGAVYFPPGDYVVNGGLTVAAEKPTRLIGAGMALNSNGSAPWPTRLIRKTGTTTILSAVGSSPNRVWLEVCDMEFRGSGTAGMLVDVQVGNSVQFHSVRFAGASATGLRMRNVFNASGSHLRWQSCGAGTASPACVFDGVSFAQGGGSNTVQWDDLQFEGNGGTDLKLTGNATNDVNTVSSEIQMSQVKMEGGTAGASGCPYIDLDYSQSCKFSDVVIATHGGRGTGPPLRKSHPYGAGRADMFVNLTIDNVGDTFTYGIDHIKAALQLENVTILGASTAAIRVRSSVSPIDLKLGKLFTNVARAVLDERTAVPTVASAATITPPRERYVSVTGSAPITTINPPEAGYMTTFAFPGSGVTVSDALGNLRLAGNFTPTANDTLTLITDGTNWYEVARSVN